MKKNSEFIDSGRNDKFSYLRGLDLQELLVQIEQFYLTYRDSLNLPSDVTFGLELEYEGFIRRSVDKFVSNNLERWESTGDVSLSSGGELISPILRDDVESWKELKEICCYLRNKTACTEKNAGGHIHVGAHILGTDCDKWRKFLKVYMVYESVIFRFVYGDKITSRKRIQSFANPISDDLYIRLKAMNRASDFESLCFQFPDWNKYQALNFQHVFCESSTFSRGNTLEFRSPNSSTQEVIWQNNVNVFVKLMLSPKFCTFDEEFLDYKLDKERVSFESNSYMYHEVCLKNALEFVDVIFDNNLDKVYFLRQYIKGFEDGFGVVSGTKSKKFIKR